MDYSKFMDDNFDVKDWVNGAFKSQKEGSKDQYATTLVMKLQMFIQEVNNVIEESCQQALQNLPRVTRELEAVRQEASLLQDQMTMVRHDIQKVEQDTAQSMEMLLQLDTIKIRMKDAADALREADNWTTLSADVDEVFDSQDVHAIANKLMGMQQSLQMLTDVPDYAERCQYLETLKNRLEAISSPQLVAAFNSQSLESAQVYVKIFTDIDRLPQLCKYYHKCQKSRLLETWRTIQEENSEATLPEQINAFYDALLSAWHAQIKWCSQLFTEPSPIVCQLLTDTLTSLEPSLPTCIERHLEEQSDPLASLIELKQITERFAKNMETALDTYMVNKPSMPQEYNDDLTKLACAIYAPYKVYIAQYALYEEAILTKALNAIRLDHSDVLDCVRLLAESVSKIFVAANKANERCVQFTNGCGYVSVLEALKQYFGEYITQFRRVLTNLREKYRPDRSSVDAEDWTWFQHSLRIIQTCGELLMQIDELDGHLVSSIVGSVGKYCHVHPTSPLRDTSGRAEARRIHPFHDYCLILLGRADDQRALELLFTSLEEGDMPSVLDDIKIQMCSLSETIHAFAFDIVFAPLRVQLAVVPTMEVWTSKSAGGALTADLPTFSLSPQEYITKVGQYLLTLPQQLEPFTLQDNPALGVAAKYGKLPYTAKQEVDEHLADLWLESVARGTMHTYCEQILKIIELTPMATRQLIMDIDYLVNVLDDLGLQSSDNVKEIVTLLQTTQEEYSEVSEKLPQRVVSAIASMRNLTLD